jgi:hypothetical protein
LPAEVSVFPPSLHPRPTQFIGETSGQDDIDYIKPHGQAIVAANDVAANDMPRLDNVSRRNRVAANLHFV